MKIISTPSAIVFGALLLLGAAPVCRLSAALQPIANTIVNGVVGEGDWGYFWNDTTQNVIRAQGGSILQVGSTYYWYGFDYDSDSSSGNNAQVYYTSTDLSNWTYGGPITLSGLPSGASSFQYHSRPRVVYNSANSNYVMAVQGPTADGGNTICFFSATSPAGPFTLQNTELVMDTTEYTDPSGQTTSTIGDHNLFVDTDGTAYLVCACADGGQVNGTILIIQLASNYLSQSSVTNTITYDYTADAREAPCIFKRTSAGNTYYYLFTSRTNSWFGSQTQYATASTLGGTWSADSDVSPNYYTPKSPGWQTVLTSPAWSDSFATQNNMVISLNGSGGVTTCVASPNALGYIYAGDRWVNKLGYGSGRHEWDVLTFDTSTVPVPTMNHYDLFYLNVAGTTVAGGANPVTSTTTYAGPPCVPSGVTAYNRTSSIWLNWNAAPGAQTYSLRRATSATGPYTTLWTGGTALSATDNSITLGTTYYYIVSAVNAAGESLVSNNPQVEANNSSFGQVAAPTGVTAVINTYGTSGSIMINWTAVTGATYYNVARSTVSGGPYTVLSPQEITATTFTDTGLAPGMTYYYVVYATNFDSTTKLTSGWSAASSEASCAAASGYESILSATVIGSNVGISWQRDLTSLTFNIYRSTTNGSWGSPIATVDTTSYVDSPGAGTFYYKVLGVTNGGTVTSYDNPSHPEVTVP